MASSPRGSGEDVRATEAIAAQAAPSGQPAADPRLLQRVLEWAEATLRSEDPLEVADMEAIRQVARRHADAPLALNPIAVELVQAMLQAQFRAHPDWLPVWQSASGEIARTLFDDPSSRERLEALWDRLLRGER
jgi:hypothetical protein